MHVFLTSTASHKHRVSFKPALLQEPNNIFFQIWSPSWRNLLCHFYPPFLQPHISIITIFSNTYLYRYRFLFSSYQKKYITIQNLLNFWRTKTTFLKLLFAFRSKRRLPRERSYTNAAVAAIRNDVTELYFHHRVSVTDQRPSRITNARFTPSGTWPTPNIHSPIHALSSLAGTNIHSGAGFCYLKITSFRLPRCRFKFWWQP